MKFLKNINLFSDSGERQCVKHKENTHLDKLFFISFPLDYQASWNNLMGRVNLSLITKTMFLQHSLTQMNLHFKVQR